MEIEDNALFRARTPSGDSLDGKKKKIRRKQKGGAHHSKKWRPYLKNTENSVEKKDNGFQATAPSNTTQFLIDQHGATTPDFDKSSDEDDTSLEDDRSVNPDFLTKEFSQEYRSYQVERLYSLTKEELVRECLSLESKFDKTGKLRKEIETLRRENLRLNDENSLLQAKMKFENRESHEKEPRVRRCGSDSVLDTERGNESLLQDLQAEMQD